MPHRAEHGIELPQCEDGEEGEDGEEHPSLKKQGQCGQYCQADAGGDPLFVRGYIHI